MVSLSTDVLGETVITIPAGTYSVDEVATQSGTSSDWIRYRPATAGTVVLRGGGRVEADYVILDGFLFDANLDPDMTDPDRAFPRGRGIDVSGNPVRIENSEVRGVNDIHNCYAATNQLNNSEFTGGINGHGVRVANGAKLTMSGVELYGFKDAGTINGPSGELIIENSLFRNSHNGISLEGQALTIRDSVFWDHPNHQFAIKTTQPGSSFILENSLLANSQDMIKAGAAWDGVDHLSVIHNTFWTPASDACGDYNGLQVEFVRESLVIRNNIFVNTNTAMIEGVTTPFFSRNSGNFMDSDFNLFYQHDPASNDTAPDEAPYEFKLNGLKTRWETWNATSCGDGNCQDGNSVIRQEPLFVAAPEYASPLPNPGSPANDWGWSTPGSVAEARGWLTLAASSPGKGAASDGLDIGIVATSLPPGGECGDGVLDAGELCDPGPPEQLNGNDCTTVPGGYIGGTLHCNATCASWNVSECTSDPGDTDPPGTPQNLRRTDQVPPGA